MSVEILDTEFWHVRRICENLRPAVRNMVEVYGKDTAERAVVSELARSFFCKTGLLDGEPLAVWGIRCSGLLADTGYVWLLGHEHIDRFPTTFLRHSRRELAEIKPLFRELHGLVLDDYSCSIRWLAWLGFTIGSAEGGVRAFWMRR